MELNSIFFVTFGIVVGVGLCGLGLCQYLRKAPPQKESFEK